MAGIQEVTDSFQSNATVNVPPIESQYEATANDSDKTFTVPGNQLWKLSFIGIVYVSSATVGNRIVTIVVADPEGNTIGTFAAGAVQAASATVTYNFLQGVPRETAVSNSELDAAIPIDLYLEPNSTMRVYDSAAIAAASDDMTVSFQYQKFIV